jgi:hypothetical protein
MRRRGSSSVGKEAVRARLRDLQLEAPRAGVENPLPVAVAVRGAARRSLVRAGADLRGRLGFDEALHRVFEDASQDVRVCALKLIEQRLVRHPVLGHRGSPGLVKSFQENSAVASLSTSSAALRSPGFTPHYGTSLWNPLESRRHPQGSMGCTRLPSSPPFSYLELGRIVTPPLPAHRVTVAAPGGAEARARTRNFDPGW